MTAPQRKLTGSVVPPSLCWCARCDDWVEPYSATAEDMQDRGAIGWQHDALTGVTMFRLPYGGPLVATETPLCGGCDSVLAPFALEALRGSACK